MGAEQARPRVLYWTEVFLPYMGGTEVVGAQLLEGLKQREYDLVIATSHGGLDLPDEELHDGIPIHRFPFREAAASRDIGLFAEIRQRVAALKRSFAPDLVHVHAVGPSLLFHLNSMAIHPAPWIFTPHTPLEDSAAGEDSILNRAFHSADWIVCVSEAQRETILRLSPETRPRCSVIYWGLETPPLSPAPLPFEPPRLLCVGRLVADKGLDVALPAVADLVGRFPGLRLTVIGEGPARGELEEQAASLGISNAVDFLGRVPEVHSHMNAATVVLMPSRWEETFGLVALEAALMGRPVVAARLGALPEVVLHERTGLLVPGEDSAALAGAVASLLDHPQRAIEMGQAARRRALESFMLDRCVDDYDTLFRRLLADRTSG